MTPQFDLKVDFCRVANGRHPLRLKAQIVRRKEGKREQKSGQRRESASSSLVAYRMSINEKNCLLVSATSQQRISLVSSMNINQPKCTTWECSYNRWQEICSLQLCDAVASHTETTMYPMLCVRKGNVVLLGRAIHHRLPSAVISRGLCLFLSGRCCWELALRGPWVNLSVLLIHWVINVAGTL